MDILAQDVIDCISNQRNAAFAEAASMGAQVLALSRENDALKKEVIDRTTLCEAQADQIVILTQKLAIPPQPTEDEVIVNINPLSERAAE